MIVGYRIIMVCIAAWGAEILATEQERWAWAYTKEFSSEEQNSSTGEIVLTKKAVPAFTQLILSWNAYRPTQGQYVFWVQGKDVQTGMWSGWHKMMMWGASVQCSYLNNAGYCGAASSCKV